MKALDWAALALIILAGCALMASAYLLGEAHGKYGERLRFAQLLLEQQSKPKVTEEELQKLCEAYYFRKPQ